MSDTELPAADAPFEEKMAYYRSQHSSEGIRRTHLFGIPGVVISLPLVFAKPKVGVPLFAASWILQLVGHKVYEKNNPALTKGFVTYQLCGLAFWCEELGQLIAERSRPVGAAARPGAGTG